MTLANFGIGPTQFDWLIEAIQGDRLKRQAVPLAEALSNIVADRVDHPFRTSHANHQLSYIRGLRRARYLTQAEIDELEAHPGVAAAVINRALRPSHAELASA